MNDRKDFLGREIDQKLQTVLVHLHDHVRKLSEFGAEVLRWDLEKQRGGDALVPPMLFLRSQIEIIESISTLIKDSLADPCNALLRSLIETTLYLEYLLQEDTERRSLSFIVWDRYRVINLIKKTDGVSEQAKRAKSNYDKDKYLSGVQLVQDKRSFLIDSENFLNGDSLKAINEEYLRVKALKKKNPNWFSLFNGPEDLEQLADRVQLNGLYEGHYRLLSDAVHGTDIVRGKFSRGKNGEFLVHQIRLPSEAQGAVLTVSSFALMSFKLYIEKRMPEKFTDFGNWFLTIQEFYKRLSQEKMITVS